MTENVQSRQGEPAECCRPLEELLELTEGWDSYGAAPPSELAVSLASGILRRLNDAGAPLPRTSPSAEDGVCMSFRNGCLYADIECFNSGEVLAAISDGKGQQHVWEVGSSVPEIIETTRLIASRLRL